MNNPLRALNNDDFLQPWTGGIPQKFYKRIPIISRVSKISIVVFISLWPSEARSEIEDKILNLNEQLLMLSACTLVGFFFFILGKKSHLFSLVGLLIGGLFVWVSISENFFSDISSLLGTFHKIFDVFSVSPILTFSVISTLNEFRKKHHSSKSNEG
jgi:Na+/proline symporter